MEFVTVVNRTSKPLEGIWDGKRRSYPPGETPNVPMIQAEAVRRQHVLMGSADPYEMNVAEYLIGIPELKHDCSPLEQSDEVERWDRTLVPGGKSAVTTKSGRSAGSFQTRAPLSTVSAFESPNG